VTPQPPPSPPPAKPGEARQCECRPPFYVPDDADENNNAGQADAFFKLVLLEA